jgi:beta-N-acetylhexosaminidase
MKTPGGVRFHALSRRALRGERSRRASEARWGGWARAALAGMTLDEKLAQMLVLPVYLEPGARPGKRFRALGDEIAALQPGGLLLLAHPGRAGLARWPARSVAALLDELGGCARLPLVVAADFEAGTSGRLADGTAFPHAMAVAATGDPADAFTVGKITAEEGRAAGIHWIFAPVADVNNNPKNPIINIRSFGEAPESVARCAAAFVRGAQAGGALACAKHFPGHGDTDVDSHLGLPVIRALRARLEAVELPPFRATIAARVGSIMLGHLVLPALEPDPRLPATFSPAIIERLLRDELGFEGLVVTDALTMDALASLGSSAEAAVRAIAAGADVLLLPPDPRAALAALREAVEQGRIPLARVHQAVRRILRAKARLGLVRRRGASRAKLGKSFPRPESARLAEEIAARGLTLLRNDANLLPLGPRRPARLLLVAISADPDASPGRALEQELRARVERVAVVRADSRFRRPRKARLPRPGSYDLAVLALFVRVADRKGIVSLPKDAAALARRVLNAGKPAIVTSFGSPYLLARFPRAQTWLAAFTTREPAERAMARALFGEAPVTGRLPVSVPGIARIGAGLQLSARQGPGGPARQGGQAPPAKLASAPADFAARLAPAFRLLDRAVRNRAFPGGVLAVGHAGRWLVHPFGQLTFARPPRRAVTAGTVYDVASLTKPVVTTTAAMLLVASGSLRLADPVGKHLPKWLRGPNPKWRARVTVADLLRHSSGLPAHRNYYRQAKGAAAILARVLAEPLVYEPGTRIVYSDLGFILLGGLIERLAGQRLDRFARRKIFAPLGMTGSFFRPPKRLRLRIAPTERDRGYRKRLVRGEVHDPNAWAMGGVAGHAGLFSTAADLAVFCQTMLQGGRYGKHRLVPRALVEQWTARKTIARSARALGWDVPEAPSSAGRFFSPRSFGHTGFTGASLWIDPEKALFVVLLTNRIYPSVKNEKIRAVRPALHDAIVKALGLAAPRPRQNAGEAKRPSSRTRRGR